MSKRKDKPPQQNQLRKDGQPSRRGAHFRDPELQRELRSRVSSESCSANGKKGFLATAAKYGRDFAVRMAAAWRRSREPTDLESQVEAWLDEFQVRYERDAPVGGYFADYLLRDFSLVVEVDGHVWHTNHRLHGQDRVSHDKRKDKVLRRQGYTVLRLPESAIRDGSAKDDLDRAITRQLVAGVSR